jgi:hypothetical protein
VSSDANGQAARARLFAGRDIGGVGQNLDGNDQRRILKVYFKSDVLLDGSTDRLVDFHRVERETLIGARRAHAKAAGFQMRPRDRRGLALDRFDIARYRAA